MGTTRVRRALKAQWSNARRRGETKQYSSVPMRVRLRAAKRLRGTGLVKIQGRITKTFNVTSFNPLQHYRYRLRSRHAGP